MLLVYISEFITDLIENFLSFSGLFQVKDIKAAYVDARESLPPPIPLRSLSQTNTGDVRNILLGIALYITTYT